MKAKIHFIMTDRQVRQSVLKVGQMKHAVSGKRFAQNRKDHPQGLAGERQPRFHQTAKLTHRFFGSNIGSPVLWVAFVSLGKSCQKRQVLAAFA